MLHLSLTAQPFIVQYPPLVVQRALQRYGTLRVAIRTAGPASKVVV
jgi:hypothetical protein